LNLALLALAFCQSGELSQRRHPVKPTFEPPRQILRLRTARFEFNEINSTSLFPTTLKSTERLAKLLCSVENTIELISKRSTTRLELLSTSRTTSSLPPLYSDSK
jgi:hypothetical protein